MKGALKLFASLFLLPIAITDEPCPDDGFYGDSNDARSYYLCRNGIESHHQCPHGEKFDAYQLTCADEVSRVRRSIKGTKGELKIVCYHISWGVYRQGIGKFLPENIDPFICTHIIYAFAKLDETTSQIAPADENSDIYLKSYEKVLKIKEKNPKLRVLLAIGGWTESKGDKYSKLVNNTENRKHFIKHVVSFLKQYGFDGLDLDWEFPVCWQADCSAGPKSDKENFSDFVKELRKAFDDEKPRLLLSAAVSASKYLAKSSYDAKSLGKYLDFVNVMAYDYHSFTDGVTGHHSAFRLLKKGPKDSDNAVSSMKYWEEHGVPKQKLILGVPAYGKTFRLIDADKHGLNAPTAGPGTKGTYTQEPGSLSYSEILEKLKRRGWKMERDPDVGPYAYGEGEWVGYDDPASCKMKARYVRDHGYGGVMIWELAAEDFNGTWGTKYPLLKSFKEGFASRGSSSFTGKGNSLLCLSILMIIIKPFLRDFSSI